MNWKAKAHLLAVISRMPSGKKIYHCAQRIANTNRLNPQESLRRVYEVVDLVRQSGRELHGATVVEIGTGWRPFLPFVLHLAGARRIFTFDVNPWLTRRYALETCKALAPYLPTIADRLKLPIDTVSNRYSEARSREATLEELLNGFSIEYRCPADARATGFAAGAVDIVCSTNVLEHVPRDILEAIHSESFRILAPGGINVHRIDPGDHFRLVDGSITGANFLRYSEQGWHWYGGSGLSYHNRLRCIEHRQLVEDAGFDVRIVQIRQDQRAKEAIESGELPIHESFGRFSIEELSADHISLVGEKGRRQATTAANYPAVQTIPLGGPAS